MDRKQAIICEKLSKSGKSIECKSVEHRIISRLDGANIRTVRIIFEHTETDTILSITPRFESVSRTSSTSEPNKDEDIILDTTISVKAPEGSIYSVLEIDWSGSSHGLENKLKTEFGQVGDIVCDCVVLVHEYRELLGF